MDRDRSLSRQEFEEVIRRASELAASEPEGDRSELGEDELFRIADEVGLPARHVRRALAELRHPAREEGALDRLLGPEELRTSRVVPGSSRAVATVLDDFFIDTQLLHPVRRTSSLLHYRPGSDWASKIARAASSTPGRYHLASAERVEARMEDLDESSVLVTLMVDPGTRGDYLMGGGVGALAAGGAAGFGGAALLASAPLLLAGAAAMAAGSLAAGAVVWQTGRSHRKKLDEVRAEMEGILDLLESGESLEPPPPSWRRWVKRNLGGMADDLFGTGGDEARRGG